MEYRLKIDDREITIGAEPLQQGAPARWTIDGAEHEVSLAGHLPHARRVILDGRPVDLHTVRTREGTWVWCEGRARLVADAEAAERRGASGAAGGGAVTPMTPGVVVEVLVSVGDSVTAGQGLVVVSAMKMESTLVAGHDGTVAAINTEAGAKVMPGDILVEVEQEEQGATDE